MFIDGIHFGIAILCADGWYKFEYAAGGASGVSGSSGSGGFLGKTSNAVTIKRSAPTGKSQEIGETDKSLNDIIEFARVGSEFHGSDYGVMDKNCRRFCAAMARFMGVYEGYKSIVEDGGYWFGK